MTPPRSLLHRLMVAMLGEAMLDMAGALIDARMMMYASRQALRL